MLRSGGAASLSRASLRYVSSGSARTASNLAHASPLRKQFCCLIDAKNRAPSALVLHKPSSTSLQRYSTHDFDKISKKHEEEVEHEKLETHPDEVTATSSVHEVFHEKGVEEEEKDIDMLAGVKSDLRVVKETFAMDEVPREALILGMAGVLPYLATSLSTVYLAFDINHATETGSGFLFSPRVAEQILHVIEPLQIGYGAVILSFLGAIHWGLEWAKYGGEHGYRRYAIGVVAPAVAWPTILFPIEHALISQFLAFCFLYFADARSVVRGWSPQWYSTYRFVLTFVVGASIVLSLIGRGQIWDQINRLPSPADRIKKLRDVQLEEMETEERYKRARMAEEEEEGEDEDEEGGDDEEE